MEVFMDERLEKALEFSNYMTTLSNQKRVLQEQYQQSLIYYINGCQFTIDRELINYTNMLVEHGNTSDVVFLDDNSLPVMISDVKEFLTDIKDTYFQALNTFYTEYNKLKSNRSIEKLVEYE
jgi:hypothetical protein